MKQQKLFYITLSALMLGSGINLLPVNSPNVPSNFVYAQELSQEDYNLVNEIKSLLAAYQPINLEQLDQVDNADLLYNYYDVTEMSSDQAVQLRELYDRIANTYNLNLVTGELYDAYHRAADAIIQASEFTYSDLNTAEPATIIQEYRQLMANNGGNVDDTVASILPNIRSRREAYLARRADKGPNDGVVAPTEDFEALRSTLISDTPITQGQLDQLSDQQLQEAINQYEAGITTVGGDIGHFFNKVYEIYPHVFESEIARIRQGILTASDLTEAQLDKVGNLSILWTEMLVFNQNGQVENFEETARTIYTDYLMEDEKLAIDEIQMELYNNTPITQDQLDQLTDEMIMDAVKETEQIGGDAGTTFQLLFEYYNEVFTAEVKRIQTAVINAGFDQTAVENYPSIDLLWENYHILIADGGENFQKLGHIISATPTENYATFLQAVMANTDITEGQLNLFTEEQLIKIIDKHGIDISDLSLGNLEIFRSMLITEVPEHFTGGQIKEIADSVRFKATSFSPVFSQEITAKIPDLDFLKWSLEAINTGGNDATYPFAQAYKTYPSLFRESLINIKKNIISNTDISQNQLDQMDNYFLLSVSQTSFDNGQPNYPEMVSQMKEKYPKLFNSKPVVKEETTVEKKASLPNTGETVSRWLIPIALGLIAIGGSFLFLGHRKSQNK